MTQEDISKEKQAIEIGDNDQEDDLEKGVVSFKKNSKVIISCRNFVCHFFSSQVKEPQRSIGYAVR